MINVQPTSTSPDDMGVDSYDVFISYARADNDKDNFVTKLYHALKQAGFEVWLDKEEIPPAADFKTEFIRGVQISDNFVPVYSSTYVHRPNCMEELNTAIREKKRIVPICRQKTIFDENEFKDLPADVQRLHAIGFDPAEAGYNFETALKELIKALKTDLDYVRAHTRLLRRAKEWDSFQQNISYLLRGDDLKNAETLQVESASKDQKFTALQSEYILASRKAEQDRQRRNRLITIAVAVVTTILAALAGVQAVRATQAAEAERIARHAEQTAKDEAILQRNEAIAQRNEAQRVAQTFAIVDNTLKQPLGSQPGRPLLVGTDLWVNSRTDGTLWRLRSDTGKRMGDPIAVGRSPRDPVYDGRWLWVSTADALVRLDSTDPTRRLDGIPVGRYPLSPLIVGDWLWVLSSDDGIITQVKRTSGRTSEPIKVDRGAQSAILGGDYVWVTNPETQTLFRIHPDTGAVLPLEIGDDPQTPVFTGDSLWLLERGDGVLRQIQPDTGKTLQSLLVGKGLRPPAVAGGFLWLISPLTKEVIQFNPTDGTEIRRLNDGVQPRSVYVEGEILWVFTDEDKLLRYQLDTGELLATLMLSSGAASPVLDGLHLWLTDTGGNQLVLIRLDTGEITRKLPNCLTPLPPIFDGANMWVTCQGENAIARIPALMGYYGLGETRQNTEPSSPIYDGRYIWISQAADKKVVQFDADSGMVLADIPVGDTPLAPMFDGRYIWVMAEKSAEITRIDTLNTDDVRVIPVGGQPQAVMRANDSIWVSGISFGTSSSYDLTWIDRVSGTIRSQYDTGMAALEPIYDAPILWVSSGDLKGLIYRYDNESGQELGVTEVGSVPWPPVLDGDQVWVVSLYDETALSSAPKGIENYLRGLGTFDLPGKLYRLNRTDGTITGTLPLEAFPSRPLLAGGRLWITQTALVPQFIGQNERGVMVIDPGAFDNPTTEPVIAGWSPCTDVTQPIYAGRFIWIGCVNLNDEISTLLVINPDTLEVTHEYHDLGLAAWPAKQIEDTVWVIYQRTGSAAVFDASTGNLLRLFGLGNHPTPPVYDGHRFVWLSNSASGTVQRIDMQAIQPPG